MVRKNEDDIINFLKENIEPLPNELYGIGYRASIYLIDGTFLPCVIFRNSKTMVDLAIKRFREEKHIYDFITKSSGYYEIVKGFVTNGNCVNNYDISKTEKSRFALPISVLHQIRGETSMGWTGFVARMNDGKYFNFGTNYNFEFFEIPEKYSVNDISEIINHSYVLKTGELKSYHDKVDKSNFNEHSDIIYRERPYFECFLDNL